MKRNSKSILILLMLASVSVLTMSCAPKQTVATSTTQTQTVQRGNISVDITAVGNLALSQTEDLALEIPGTVEDVSVQVGDTIKKGDVLVTLDTTQWDAQVTSLVRAVTSANRTVTAKQKALRDAQNAVLAAQNNVISKQYAVTQAQLDLQTANDTLNQIAVIKSVQDEIDNAEYALKFARAMSIYTADINYQVIANSANQSLVDAKARMKALLQGTSLTVSSDAALDVAKKQLIVQQKQLGIDQAQLDLQNTQNALSDANNALAPAQEDIKNAQDDLKTAQNNLDDARSKSPKIIAPFAGFVTAVPVKGGDDVKKGTVAVTVSDPTKFEADLMVNETDISKIKLGSAATIVPQAASSITYSANVTRIAPTATIQQGVVNYRVTVEVGPVVAGGAERGQTGASFGSGNVSTGNGSLRQQFPTGNLTQEQINQIQQRQQVGGNQSGPNRGAFGSGTAPTQDQINQFIQQRQSSGGRQFQATASSATTLNLAAGMTVTVTIPVQSRINVLLVPNGAITTSGGQATVKVVTSGNVTESRPIQTGISDAQNTEVTSGLNLGDKIEITTRTSSSNSNTNRTGIPGLGGGGGVFIER